MVSAPPIGTKAQAGGVGRRALQEKPGEGGEKKLAPRGEGWKPQIWGPGGQASDGGARSQGLPPPLPRPSHKGAQGPRFLLSLLSWPRPVGSAPSTAAGRVSGPRLPRALSGLGWEKGAHVTRLTPLPHPPPQTNSLPQHPPPPTGCLRQRSLRRLPYCLHPPGRPGGSVKPRPWLRAGSSVSPPPQRCYSQRGEGRVPSWRRRPAETPGKPTSFFFLTHPPPPTPSTHPEGFP